MPFGYFYALTQVVARELMLSPRLFRASPGYFDILVLKQLFFWGQLLKLGQIGCAFLSPLTKTASGSVGPGYVNSSSIYNTYTIPLVIYID